MLIFPKEILWTHIIFLYLQNDPCVHGVASGKINMAYNGLWVNALSKKKITSKGGGGVSESVQN